jgi:hypothetical protein
MIHPVDIRGNLGHKQMRRKMMMMCFCMSKRGGGARGDEYLIIEGPEKGETLVNLTAFLLVCIEQLNNTCSGINRTEEEEEGIRASESIDRILSRLSKSDVVVKGKPR